MKRIIGVTMGLVMSGLAWGNVITHPDINPDIMHELFMSATLVECVDSVCKDAVTKVPYESITVVNGWVVIYDVTVMERLQLTETQLLDYQPTLMSMMRAVAKELGAPTDGM